MYIKVEWMKYEKKMLGIIWVSKFENLEKIDVFL